MKKIKIGLFGKSGKMGQALSQVILLDPSLSVVDKKPDVWIDFSNHENLDHVIKTVSKDPAALICGTTGYSAKEFNKLKKLSTTVPVMWSGNMSFGIQLLLRMLDVLNQVEHCDIQVIEAHHRNKKDAPSGTGLMIQTEIDKITKKNKQKGLRPAPLSVRGGGIFGEHEVKIMFDEETLEIKHTALNRLVFAKGAVLAAKAIVSKKPGYYTFSDVLKF